MAFSSLYKCAMEKVLVLAQFSIAILQEVTSSISLSYPPDKKSEYKAVIYRKIKKFRICKI